MATEERADLFSPISPSSPTPSMMPEAHRAEELSLAYVLALAAKAGVNYSLLKRDYGIDISFRRPRIIDGEIDDSGSMMVDAQLKASRNYRLKGDYIVYDLPAKNYRKLVNSIFSVLLLLCLPPSIDHWLHQSEECLSIYKCCYYWRPQGHVEIDQVRSKTIYVPKANLFTEAVLLSLLDEAQAKVRL
ncbi:DUF4365 domain-containing protein [Thermogemmatispora carboxidivorans]|uniref:DUF4365 domain-containing protein n=1 Tax=Thermogemmatispora carboxidivorans TaxID=1382306 RepID=UPI0006997281|nr:DUF4365 domain-containing protein [Thermogemmatispora carboxidivorans]